MGKTCFIAFLVLGSAAAFTSPGLLLAGDVTQKVIVQNELGKEITDVKVYLSWLAAPVSPPSKNVADKIDPRKQEELDVSGDNQQYRWAQLEYRVDGQRVRTGGFLVRGRRPYPLARYIVQVIFRVRSEDGSMNQAQIDESPARGLPGSSLSEDEVAQVVAEVKSKIEMERRNAEQLGARFVAADDESIRGAIVAGRPCIRSLSIANSSPRPGERVTITAYVANYGDEYAYPLSMALSFGPFPKTGDPSEDLNLAVTAMGARQLDMPYLTTEQFRVDPGQSVSKQFVIHPRPNVVGRAYLFNVVLFDADPRSSGGRVFYDDFSSSILVRE